MSPQWQPISDYETPPEALADKELYALAAVWKEQRSRLAGLAEFTERLNREWAIETGLIERLYALDRGVTELLIERGLNAALIPHRSATDAVQTIAMIGDQKGAIDSVFSFVKQHRNLSTGYVKELHSLFTRHQPFTQGRDQFGNPRQIPLDPGVYKRQSNNPTRPDGTLHHYCPPVHVAAEMDRLIALHRNHQDNDVAPEVEAAWFHHRFVQIHPFTDGNGRVARALATLVFISSDWLPLVVRDNRRADYISALERADDGDLKPLVAFFSALQRQEFVKALSIARDVERSARVDTRIKAIGRRLAKRQDALEQEWAAALSSAQRLHQFARDRLSEVQELLQGLPLDSEFTFFVDDAEDRAERSHYFRRQIVSTAKELRYYANTSHYRSWVRLVVRDGSQSTMLIAFHCVGHEFRGVLVGSATWFRRVPIGDDEVETEGETPICDDVFQINYKEDIWEVEKRFEDWLESTIERGLARWESTL